MYLLKIRKKNSFVKNIKFEGFNYLTSENFINLIKRVLLLNYLFYIL